MQSEEELKKALQTLGYSDYYSRVFLALASAGAPCDAKKIAGLSNVPLTRIYSILLALERDGLIRSVPGKLRLYDIQNKKDIVHALTVKASKEIEQREAKSVEAVSFLDGALAKLGKGAPAVEVKYFFNDPNYWLALANSERKVKPGQVIRVLNTGRQMWGFLDEELEANPTLKNIVLSARKQRQSGVCTCYLFDPRGLVESTMSDLNDHGRILLSLAQNLSWLKVHKQTIYGKVFYGMRNIVVEITPDAVFIEFYSGPVMSHTLVANAIMMKGKDAVDNFTAWFDALSHSKHNPERDYTIFEREIKKWASKLAGIKPAELEKAMLKA